MLLGMNLVSMDTGCWFGPLELLSPSKVSRTGWGRGWVVWILDGDAEGRDRKESDCSRCDVQLTCILNSLQGFSGFFWRHRSQVSPLCLFCAFSILKVPFFLGPVPALNVCLHFSSGNSPHPAHCPKPSGQICNNSHTVCKTVNSITTFPH